MDWRPVLKTAYLTSLASEMGFLLLEWLRPGFVTDVFSPHVFLAAALVFGVLWGRKEDTLVTCNWKLVTGVAIVLGVLLAWVVWYEGRALGEFRILATVAVLFVPILVLYSRP